MGMLDFIAGKPRPGTFRSLLSGIGALVLTRAELLALEAQEHKDHLIISLFIGGIALLLFLIGSLAMLLLIVLLTPENGRVWVLAVLAGLPLMGSLILLIVVRKRLQQQMPPFTTTLAEIRKDWEALKGQG